MVELRVMVEGGGQPNVKDVSVAYNTQVLRQSLHSFFSRLLGRDDVSIVISMEFGYRNAVQEFLKKDDTYLFVDLDAKKSKIDDWFVKLENENPDKPLCIALQSRKNVYFMIQEMETWFLKQPQCLEKWGISEGWQRLHPSEKIEEHSLIAGKNIEDIVKPSEKLKILMRHFFEKQIKNGKRKLAQYGKLRDAPILLDSIDVSQLVQQDSELQRFKSSVYP